MKENVRKCRKMKEIVELSVLKGHLLFGNLDLILVLLGEKS